MKLYKIGQPGQNETLAVSNPGIEKGADFI